MKKIYLPLLFLSSIVLSACAPANNNPNPLMPTVQPMAYKEPDPTYDNPGSLFNQNEELNLYADGRARRVGDIVFVNITENNTATNAADTDTNKESSISFGIPQFFGKDQLTSNIPVGANLFQAESESEFTGDGSTSRSNSITATVAARIVRVLPDGLLQVEGARETRVNNETQYIVVTGLIRSRDIQADNSILSTNMANSKVEYWGSGVIADKQKAGWLTRLLDNIWPL